MFPTVDPAPRRLLVFARIPELGKVKTRLAETIGEAKALAVYEAMLRDVLASLGTASPEMEIEILWAPTEAAGAELLERAFGDFPTAMQTGDTLGDRLAMAMSERFFFHRTDAIIAIGVDAPQLTRETIDHAFSLLDSCEWVVGPAADGGYYLIGSRAASFDVSVFRDIEWGTDSVLRTTLSRIRERKDSVALLPLHHDIDREEDLRRLAAEPREGALPALLREWSSSA